MADSSFNANVTTKMLMPHELTTGTSANANTTSLVGQHSIHSAFNDLHHGTSFYHSTTASTTTAAAAVTGFNGFHNSTFHNSYTHNGINTLVHQQQPHPITTVSATMPPPLILYNQPHQTSSLYTNTLSNTNVVASRQSQQQQQKSTEGATEIESESNTIDDQQTTTEEETTAVAHVEEDTAVEEESEEPEIDIVISNVVCAFSVRCHLSLKHIALQGANVEFKRENGMVTMKLRKPYTTASIWSSGEFEI